MIESCFTAPVLHPFLGHHAHVSGQKILRLIATTWRDGKLRHLSPNFRRWSGSATATACQHDLLDQQFFVEIPRQILDFRCRAGAFARLHPYARGGLWNLLHGLFCNLCHRFAGGFMSINWRFICDRWNIEQVSFPVWRFMLYVYWLILITFSVVVLLLVYTYQFHGVPQFWQSYTPFSNATYRKYTQFSIVFSSYSEFFIAWLIWAWLATTAPHFLCNCWRQFCFSSLCVYNWSFSTTILCGSQILHLCWIRLWMNRIWRSMEVRDIWIILENNVTIYIEKR